MRSWRRPSTGGSGRAGSRTIATSARLYRYLVGQGFDGDRAMAACASAAIDARRDSSPAPAAEPDERPAGVREAIQPEARSPKPVQYQMTSDEIRASFLAYFAKQGHRVVPSSPLVPHDDPTLLFTNAGMNQFKDVFLGRENARLHARHHVAEVHARQRQAQRPRQRRAVASGTTRSSRCWATSPSATTSSPRRSTWPGTLLTGDWKLDPDRLFVTVFKGETGIPRDDEAYDIWRTLGVPADRIGELGADDNFWRWATPARAAGARRLLLPGHDLPCARQAACRGWMRLRSLRRDLEQRVHGVRPRRPTARCTPLPAPSHRHRHGPRARHGGAAGQAVELRDRSLHADPAAHRRDAPA